MKRRVIFRRIEGNLYYSFCENPISFTLQHQSQLYSDVHQSSSHYT